MLSRFSVKKPYIVTVAVIIILILGGVSLTKMKTDLLPDMDLPYLAVITTDPGASAEKVESEVTDVLEGSLSKVSGVSSVQSQRFPLRLNLRFSITVSTHCLGRWGHGKPSEP